MEAGKRTGDEQEPAELPELQDAGGAVKRLRKPPSFATVIRQAVIAKSLQNFCLSLEPLLRRVVQEELQRMFIERAFSTQRSTTLHGDYNDERAVGIAGTLESSSPLQLEFVKPPALPIFTASRIEDEDGRPLRVRLVDPRTGHAIASSAVTTKLQVVVVNGDFPAGGGESWTAEEFNASVVKEREGKRPLLVGDVFPAMRDDGFAVVEELSFTDNSSWTRSRHFRIAVRVAGAGELHGRRRVKEAITKRFMVKDHRGELYKKHYPPALGDEVWRLDRIGKEGIFHTKLKANGIHTVQDFLKIAAVDPSSLRDILGMGMSERMYEATLAHAKTCVFSGEKRYWFNSPAPPPNAGDVGAAVVLNPACEVEFFFHGGVAYHPQQLNAQQKEYAQEMARQAYLVWDQLSEVDEGILFNINDAGFSGSDSPDWDYLHDGA